MEVLAKVRSFWEPYQLGVCVWSVHEHYNLFEPKTNTKLTLTRMHSQHTHTHTHVQNSVSVNFVIKLISGELGFRFKKAKPLTRLIFIHTENRHVTFSRTKIYAGFVDVGNRTVLHPDGTKSGDWRQAIVLAPGIRKLPVEEGSKFYTPEGRRGQLKEVPARTHTYTQY